MKVTSEHLELRDLDQGVLNHSELLWEQKAREDCMGEKT